MYSINLPDFIIQYVSFKHPVNHKSDYLNVYEPFRVYICLIFWGGVKKINYQNIVDLEFWGFLLSGFLVDFRKRRRRSKVKREK